MTIRILDSYKCITNTNGLNERAIAQIQGNTFVFELFTKRQEGLLKIFNSLLYATFAIVYLGDFTVKHTQSRSERRLLQTTFKNVKKPKRTCLKQF